MRIALFSLLAVAISAFIIFGAYYSLGFGKNDFSNPDWSFKTKFDFLDFFTKFLPGTYDTVRPSGLPLVYCGVLALFLVPVYFMTKKISSREKISSLIFICIFVLSFIARPLDLIWHGFQSPNWLNYRYSFMLCFFLLVLAYKGFGNLRSVSEKFILGLCAFIILFVTVCDKLEFASYIKSNEALLNLETVWLTIFASVAFLVMLCLLIRQRNPVKRENIAAILAVLVCIEVFCSGLTCVVQHKSDVGGYTTSKATYSYYNNFIGGLRPIVNDIYESDTGFYRAEKLVHKKKNDNMAIGLRGISNSTSTLNTETIRFLNRMGYIATSNYSFYYGGNPVNDSLLGVKYIIDSNDSSKLVNLYEPYLTNGNYTAYLNDRALSLAYGVDSSVADFDMAKYTSSYEPYDRYFQRMNDLVASMLGDPDASDIFISIDRSNVKTAVSSDCEKNDMGSTVTYSSGSEDDEPTIRYIFNVPQSAEYYFYAPSKGSSAVDLEVVVLNEGKETESYIDKYLSNDKKYVVPIGYFEEGSQVTVKMTMQEDKLTLYKNYDYIWYIDDVAFDEAFTELQKNPQLDITEFTDDNLKGTISTNKDVQMIQTTIPYDEGWRIYVDGEEVETFKTLDALIAFNIESIGDHSIEFKYSPSIYRLGAIISLTGIGTFVLLCLLELILYLTVIKRKNIAIYSNINEDWVLEDFDRDHEERLLYSSLAPKTFKERVLNTIQKVKNKFSKNNDKSNDNTSQGDT